jgi:hypothetical protein
MIVGSIVLILVAVGLLVTGVAKVSDPMIYGSIAASVLAAIALIAGVRALAGSRAVAEGPPMPAPTRRPRAVRPRAGWNESTWINTGAATAVLDPARLDDPDIPTDEPAPQRLTNVQVEQLGYLPDEVLVVDSRPRFHLPGCLHLLGRAYEPIAVAEAVELGFSPCAQCQPAQVLLSRPISPAEST